MKMLMAQLYQRQRDDEEAKKREIEGKKKKIEWGSQIRSYVLDCLLYTSDAADE